MRYYLILTLIALTGCASAPPAEDRYAQCVLPVVRDAGMGVKVKGCHAWEFKPSLTQQARFGKQRLTTSLTRP